MPKKKRGRPRKLKLKEKLSLTISPDIRRKARILAKRHRRSVSSLIEFLIAVEYRRTKGQYSDKDSGIYRISRNVMTGVGTAASMAELLT